MNNTSIEFRNRGDANVSISQIDYGGEIALKIIQAILGVAVFIILSPVAVPMILMEMRKQGRLEGGE